MTDAFFLPANIREVNSSFCFSLMRKCFNLPCRCMKKVGILRIFLTTQVNKGRQWTMILSMLWHIMQIPASHWWGDVVGTKKSEMILITSVKKAERKQFKLHWKRTLVVLYQKRIWWRSRKWVCIAILLGQMHAGL